MLNTINGVNMFLRVSLFWGSDSKDVQQTNDSFSNVTILNPEQILKVDIYSSLAYPFFHGSFVYVDDRSSSLFRRMADIPIVYGQFRMCVVNGSDIPGDDNVPEPLKGEDINEEIFITGIDTFDDGSSEYVHLKVHFITTDYLKFIANMKGISTFNSTDGKTKTVSELFNDMFGAVGLGDKLDRDSITMDVSVPYISTENDTLLNGLDYVYRKIFDYDFREHNGKSYCRFVYDFDTHKYVLWKFEDVGTKKSLENDEQNPVLKNRRELVSINAQVGGLSMNIDGKAFIKNCGDQSILFESFSDLKFVDYDYLTNTFTDIEKAENGNSFMSHDDEMGRDDEVAAKYVMGNYRLFKDNTYERTFSTSRQNGSFYDVFTEAIFNTAFMRVEADGSIGRRAGNSVAISFANNEGTIYQNLNGEYLITAINSHYENDGEVKVFKSIMDLYRPYCKADSSK